MANVCSLVCGDARAAFVMGIFQSLIDPGEPVPAFIRLLTGISDDMLLAAPAIEQVLPNFLEFVGGSVVVAHNARFDVGFDAALTRLDYPRIGNRPTSCIT